MPFWEFGSFPIGEHQVIANLPMVSRDGVTALSFGSLRLFR
jgi:hypothetical protein